METKMINPGRDFSTWDMIHINELQSAQKTDPVGKQLVFEDDRIKVWNILLLPGERLGFHTHTRNYNWTCLTSGKAVSRYGTGVINEITYSPGDMFYYNHDKYGDFTHDLENTGNTALEFCTVEYKFQELL